MKNKCEKRNVKKWIVIALFTIATILSIVFMGKVTINYNLADYLGEDTQTKIALDIIDEQFSMTGNIQVMAKHVSADLADEMCEKIETIPNVQNVNFDKFDTTYYKDNNALFIVIVNGDDYSENAKQVVSDIQSLFSSYEGIEYGGTTIEKQSLQEAITNEMVYIFAIAICLVIAILLITSQSWIEPIVLLIASGVAILINRGTNIFFDEISYITNSISAILQLALSIDYSIVLLHHYRREKEKNDKIEEAMKNAIKSVVKPVSASALTTMAGLLALLFMSFRIGFDIGIVLMKGIIISVITALTLLPVLILLFDKPMKKTQKKAFVPKGNTFCKTSIKMSKYIVPIALIIVILCGFLQMKNEYMFTDTKAGNTEITEVFGSNNSVVVIYKNTDDNFANEQALATQLAAYQTSEGKNILTNYTAYTNTVREEYDIQKAMQKLELSKEDTEMLFTMYNLSLHSSDIQMTFSDFIDFANVLVDTDADAKAFIDSDIMKTLKTLNAISEILKNEFTAEELYIKFTTGVMEETDLPLFSIKQLYGMYFYDTIMKKDVDFQTMLNFMITISENEEIKDWFPTTTVEQLATLQAGISQFENQMNIPMDKATFQGYCYQNFDMLFTDEQLEQIWEGYYFTMEEPTVDTIPFLSLMQYLVSIGQITDENILAKIHEYTTLYAVIHTSYEYEQFLPTLETVAMALSGKIPEIAMPSEAIQSVYIMYFEQIGTLENNKINGQVFTKFVTSMYETNAIIQTQLTNDDYEKLNDILTIDKYMADQTTLTYENIYEQLSVLQSEIKSNMTASGLEKDKILGVYIQYAIYHDNVLSSPMMAYELLDFIIKNMDNNILLKQKMTEENREKVTKAQKDIEKARNLFVGKQYSRMLLSVDLPNESEETTQFIEYLQKEVNTIFGEEAYITGGIVSTYDLEKSFAHDNLFITIFTLISICIIVMIIFQSLSLPIILVAIIQGAIYIAMSTQLLGNEIFFMSYIVSTCILMGATIDYGILMSSNYVAYRSIYSKEEALERSVETAMPTVFTSGLILIVCGFVIHFISSQNSISTVGLLIGIGTLCSVVMITTVLPSVLYLLDKFILKLSFNKNHK